MFNPGDEVRVYKEQDRRWCGLVQGISTAREEVTVPERGNVMNFDLSNLLPSSRLHMIKIYNGCF